MSTKWSCGNSSKDVAPSSLINMIKEHARDQQLLDLIKSFPSSVHEVDLVSSSFTIRLSIIQHYFIVTNNTCPYM